MKSLANHKVTKSTEKLAKSAESDPQANDVIMVCGIFVTFAKYLIINLKKNETDHL